MFESTIKKIINTEFEEKKNKWENDDNMQYMLINEG